jgi:uncharacterized phage protein (TIGR01671 family)
MREIKFRIWNAQGQCMHQWPELVEKNKIHLLNAKNPNYIVMQFTGLKDKNGIEIYEGDILNAYHSEFEESIVADVRFENATFTIGKYWKDGAHDWTSMEQYEQFDLEVIGNIHENPELRG